MLVLVLGPDRSTGGAVSGWTDVVFGGSVSEGALDDVVVLDLLVFSRSGQAQKLFAIGDSLDVRRLELISTVRRGADCDWHFEVARISSSYKVGIGMFDVQSKVVDEINVELCGSSEGKREKARILLVY
jgi:hypothetical protein